MNLITINLDSLNGSELAKLAGVVKGKDWLAVLNMGGSNMGDADFLGEVALYREAPALLAALEDFAMGIWSDFRLPAGVRADFRALYYNGVISAITRARGGE